MEHVKRMDETEPVKLITRQVPVWKRSVGRQRARYMKQVEQDSKQLKTTGRPIRRIGKNG